MFFFLGGGRGGFGLDLIAMVLILLVFFSNVLMFCLPFWGLLGRRFHFVLGFLVGANSRSWQKWSFNDRLGVGRRLWSCFLLCDFFGGEGVDVFVVFSCFVCFLHVFFFLGGGCFFFLNTKIEEITM